MSDTQHTPEWMKEYVRKLEDVIPLRSGRKHLVATARDLIWERNRLAALNAELVEALEEIKSKMCEGFCKDFPADFICEDMEIDCSVCKVRAALARARGES